MRYLVDSSVWIAAERDQEIARAVDARFDDRALATCAPVALEVLNGPRDGGSYEADWNGIWRLLHWLPFDERVGRRALEVQRGLAQTTAGAHRRGALDYLIAACAELAGADVVLWHRDRDLRLICEFTGQPHEPA